MVENNSGFVSQLFILMGTSGGVERERRNVRPPAELGAGLAYIYYALAISVNGTLL